MAPRPASRGGQRFDAGENSDRSREREPRLGRRRMAWRKQRARRCIVGGAGPSLRRGGAELHSPPCPNPCADMIRPQWGRLALHTQKGGGASAPIPKFAHVVLQKRLRTLGSKGALAWQCASAPADVDAAAATRHVSARALPYLWDGCRGSADQGCAVAGTLHVAGRALRTLQRR